MKVTLIRNGGGFSFQCRCNVLAMLCYVFKLPEIQLLNINPDYSKRVVINRHDLAWVTGLMPGDEVVKATPIAYYQAGSQ
jgi:hypothetical protein